MTAIVVDVDFVECELAAKWRVTLLACGNFLYQVDQNIDR